MDVDAQPIGARHQPARTQGDDARRLRRGDVQPEDGRRRGVRQRALVDHRLGAARAAFEAFLVGLEQELHRAGELGAIFRQDLGHAHQDGDMGVVTAGMHDAGHLALPHGLRLGGEGQVDPLLDRQRIHVGAQRHDRAGLAALEHADHAGFADPGRDLVAQGAQVPGRQRRRARLVIGKLGMLMDVAPPGDDLGLEAKRRRRDPLRDLAAGLRADRIHRCSQILPSTCSSHKAGGKARRAATGLAIFRRLDRSAKRGAERPSVHDKRPVVEKVPRLRRPPGGSARDDGPHANPF